jgi:hypothetical protein
VAAPPEARRSKETWAPGIARRASSTSSAASASERATSTTGEGGEKRGSSEGRRAASGVPTLSKPSARPASAAEALTDTLDHRPRGHRRGHNDRRRGRGGRDGGHPAGLGATLGGGDRRRALKTFGTIRALAGLAVFTAEAEVKQIVRGGGAIPLNPSWRRLGKHELRGRKRPDGLGRRSRGARAPSRGLRGELGGGHKPTVRRPNGLGAGDAGRGALLGRAAPALHDALLAGGLLLGDGLIRADEHGL